MAKRRNVPIPMPASRAAKSDNASAYNQALAFLQEKQPAKALPILQKLAVKAPKNADIWHMWGVALRQSGQPQKAIDLISKALTLRPTYAEAQHNLGNALTDLGLIDEAIACFRKAVELRSDYFDAHVNLGAALMSKGDASGAVSAYKAAIALQPDQSMPYLQLATALRAIGHIEQSNQILAMAEKIAPDNIQVLTARAANLKAQGHRSEALKILQKAYAKHSQSIEVQLGLASMLEESGQRAEAEKIYIDALETAPKTAELHCNYGLLLHVMGRFAEAEEKFRRAITLAPNLAYAHWNLANTLLITGRIAEGLREYEWRWRRAEVRHGQKDSSQKRWQGESIAGKHIVIFPDQGFGDTLQFARYAPLLATRGAQVTLQVQKELLSLLQPSLNSPQITVISSDDPAPDCDFTCPIMSLPGAFGTDENSIPAHVPYLTVPAQYLARWQAEIERRATPHTLRIGLVWAGNPNFRRDFSRSPGVEAFLDIFKVPNTSVFCLQLGEGRGRLADILLPNHVHDLGPQIQDFSDTAAIMANLDLIISSCTASAHLAGALSRPLWLMLETVPDWRWRSDGETSPWYPTARLFRKRAGGDWLGLEMQVIAALRERL